MKNQNTFHGLWVRERSRFRLISFDQISHIYHSDGISEVLLGDKTIKKLHTPLSNLLQIMPGDIFFQAHRNYLVNTQHIDHFDPAESIFLELKGVQVPLSRRRRKQLDHFLNQNNA